MTRKETPQPLLGAAPRLQPTARVTPMSPGATPAAKSPLMELAQAFDNFNGELRNGLRDAAAREEQDAFAAGEIEANKAQAEGKMADLEKVIKGEVDAGRVPAVRTPAFIRGVASTVGHTIAQTDLQNALSEGLNSMAVLDGQDPVKKMEAIVGAAYKAGADKVAGNFYAQQAYNDQASGLMAQFRQQANAVYTASYKRYGEQTLATAGIETAKQAAASSAEDMPAAQDALKANLDALRKILPTTQVNSFYLQNVVKPAITSLSEDRKFTEASQLLQAMEELDVTGKGGLLGRTMEGIEMFSGLRKQLDEASRYTQNTELTRLKAEQELSAITANQKASNRLLELKKAHGGKLPDQSTIQGEIDKFTAENSDGVAVAAYRDAFTRERNADATGRVDEAKSIGLLQKVEATLDLDSLERYEALAETMNSDRTIDPAHFAEVQNKIAARRTIVGSFGQQDGDQALFEIFGKVSSQPGMSEVLGFGLDSAGKNPAQEIWDSPAMTDKRDLIKAQVQAFYSQTAVQELRALTQGDATRVGLEKGNANNVAIMKSKAYAAQLIKKEAETSAFTAAAKDQAKAKQVKERALPGWWTRHMHRHPTLSGTYSAVSDELDEEESVTGTPVYKMKEKMYQLPTVQGALAIQEKQAALGEWAADVTKPAALREWFYFGPNRPDLNSLPVKLEDIARDIREQAEPGAQAKAKEFYGTARGINGYTPQEIIDGVTRHGVPINASQIVTDLTPVFTSMEELEKHWNSSKPDATFEAVWSKTNSTTDPQPPVRFYKAQRMLLKR